MFKMQNEKTLIILKPDCLQKNLAGEVLARFQQKGFRIVACKMQTLSPNILREHYAHLAGEPFFPRIEAFMRSHPVILLIMEAENAIARARQLLGPTDSEVAPKGTIRGDWGTDKMCNIAHASDSAASAHTEIRRFFLPHEIFGSKVIA